MPTAIAMPKLGMSMREGRVVAWPVAPGRRVAQGEVVLVIESEKSEVEIEAPASGVVRHVYVAPDETVPCGTLLAALTETADEPFDAEAFRRAHGGPAATGSDVRGRAQATARDAAGARDVPVGATEPASLASAVSAAGPPRGAPITPAARARARELGVDVGVVAGTGPGGRVTREDVEDFAARRRSLVPVADGVSLEVPSDGTGDVVLLLPGFGTDASAFARQTPALVSRFRVRGVNPRGVGGSDAPEAACYAIETLAADVAAVAAGRVHVVGASLGAAVAIELALAHPERVRSLVLLTPLVDVSPRLDAVLEAWCRVARGATPETLARMLLPWFFSERTLADGVARERTVRGLAGIVGRVPVHTLERTAAGLRAWSGTRRAALRALRAPTLVVAASSDLLAPDGPAVAAAIPGAKYLQVPDAGHAVGLEAADEVNQAIVAHLAAAG